MMELFCTVIATVVPYVHICAKIHRTIYSTKNQFCYVTVILKINWPVKKKYIKKCLDGELRD